ncbi:TPA: transposase [Enterococcus faecium]|nr:transposase [Enterococcus faecium]HBC2770121.1 transposase [Enterococcus faecium]
MSSSSAYTKQGRKYPITFTPKYRRKIIYNQYRADLQEIIKRLCRATKE